MAQAREAGIHFIAAGHYATETLRHPPASASCSPSASASRHVFVDVPNPV